MPPRNSPRRVTLVSGLLLAGVSATTGAIIAQPWSAMADPGWSGTSATTAPAADPPVMAEQPSLSRVEVPPDDESADAEERPPEVARAQETPTTEQMRSPVKSTSARAKISGADGTPDPVPARSDPPAPDKSDKPTAPTTAPPSATPGPASNDDPAPAHTAQRGVTTAPASPKETSGPAPDPAPSARRTAPRPATPRPTSKPAATKEPARAAPSPTGDTPRTVPQSAPLKPVPPAQTARPTAGPTTTPVPDARVEKPAAEPETPQPLNALPSPAVRAVLPLPPLAHVSSTDLCLSQDASCWSLAPWRSRTLFAADPLNAKQRTVPQWAFAPPPARPVLLPSASVPWAPAPVRAGCWSFSPSSLCARSWEKKS
ncbi:hypothetical protein FHR32_002951 [Streptosporangium album]|uniref:Uncharacterized protein n=1 Tax=Streptosporangium album TaxID=47479 RepID=A0A7W7RUU6_9ACTN|nr:hypothetical protein [Streptosporangium album]MBB4938646.1 hypothetical protein [Streptosporangium album]